MTGVAGVAVRPPLLHRNLNQLLHGFHRHPLLRPHGSTPRHGPLRHRPHGPKAAARPHGVPRRGLLLRPGIPRLGPPLTAVLAVARLRVIPQRLQPLQHLQQGTCRVPIRSWLNSASLSCSTAREAVHSQLPSFGIFDRFIATDTLTIRFLCFYYFPCVVYRDDLRSCFTGRKMIPKDKFTIPTSSPGSVSVWCFNVHSRFPLVANINHMMLINTR